MKIRLGLAIRLDEEFFWFDAIISGSVLGFKIL
jgi:hypothetical protein